MASGVLQGRVFLPQLFQKLVLANGLDEELPLDAGGGVHGLPVEVDIPLDHRRKGDNTIFPTVEKSCERHLITNPPQYARFVILNKEPPPKTIKK